MMKPREAFAVLFWCLTFDLRSAEILEEKHRDTYVRISIHLTSESEQLVSSVRRIAVDNLKRLNRGHPNTKIKLMRLSADRRWLFTQPALHHFERIAPRVARASMADFRGVLAEVLCIDQNCMFRMNRAGAISSEVLSGSDPTLLNTNFGSFRINWVEFFVRGIDGDDVEDLEVGVTSRGCTLRDATRLFRELISPLSPAAEVSLWISEAPFFPLASAIPYWNPFVKPIVDFDRALGATQTHCSSRFACQTMRAE